MKGVHIKKLSVFVLILICFNIIESTYAFGISNNFKENLDEKVFLEKEYILKLFGDDIDITGKYNNDTFSICEDDQNAIDSSLVNTNEFLDERLIDLNEGLWWKSSIDFNSVTNEVYSGKINVEGLQNIKVAILDSGIDYDHPDLKDNIVEGYSFINDSTDASDDYGHGTKIAGVIGGKTTGVAYGAKLMPVKIMDKNGFGKTEDLVKGIIWAVDNGANVINLSLGRRKYIENQGLVVADTFNELERLALKYALVNDVTVVTVSGNSNEGMLYYPAAYQYKKSEPSQIIVSGVNGKMERAALSNYAGGIDVAAPAEYVLSTFPKELDNKELDKNIEGDGYAFCNGTSFAGAYVTGLAATLKALNSKLSNTEIKNIITTCSKDIGESGIDKYFGNGIIDYYKSLITSRIKITPDKNVIERGEDVSLAVMRTDVYGNNRQSVTESTYSETSIPVYQAVYMNVSKYISSIDTFVLKDSSVEQMVNGKLDINRSFDDVGFFEVSFLSKDKSFVHNSTRIEVVPNPTITSIEPGTYQNNIVLQLGSITPGSKIYYTFGSMPVLVSGELNTSAIEYSGAINIAETATINTVVIKNDIFSAVKSFTYNISKPVNNRISTTSNNNFLEHKTVDLPGAIQNNLRDSVLNINESNIIQNPDKTLYLCKLEEKDSYKFSIKQDLFLKICNEKKGLGIDTEKIKFSISPYQMEALKKYEEITIECSKPEKYSSKEFLFGYRVSVKSKGKAIDSNNILSLIIRVEDKKNINYLYSFCANENDKSEHSVKNYFVPGYIVIPYTNDADYVGKIVSSDFKDIKDTVTYDCVNFLWLRGIISGIDKDTFDPDTTLTRAQFAALINRYINVEYKVNNEDNCFKDIRPQDWFYKDLLALYNAGIINGISESLISPNEKIKKQDLIILLTKTYMNYFGVKNIKINETEDFKYKDKADISKYAELYIKYAEEIGLIDSENTEELNPQHYVTRGEAAELLYEFVINTMAMKYN